MSIETPGNITKLLDVDIQAIRSNILRMGGLAEEQLRSALHVFLECDVARVDALIAGDRDIDQLELEVDRQCASLIARRQPVAIDLRIVVMISKMVTDLERIGDESKKIARSTHRGGDWQLRQLLAHEINIADLGQLADNLLSNALDAYVRLDRVLAESALRSDKEIDAVYRSICHRLTERMMTEPQMVPAAMELFSTAKSLERIGDHAKKIAKYVIFIVSGEDVRHISRQGI